jgi:basic membrane protein A
VPSLLIRAMSRLLPLATYTAVLFAASPGCSLITAQDVGKGVGDPCQSKADCQGESAVCEAGVCAVKCSQNSDCPAPSTCGNGLCQMPLKVAFIYVGVPQDEGWTLTHDLGRQYAQQQLPFLQTETVNNTFLFDQAVLESEKFIANGAQVVVLNSFSLRKVAEDLGPKHPNVKFLTCSSNNTGPNFGSYFARSYQAWYLAGFAAGRKTKTNRIGFVGSFVTPEVVRHINAFTLGARRANPAVQVEVRWEGFWFDLDPPDPVTNEFNETRLTKQLIDTGCDVIGHNSDTGRTVEAVEQVAQATDKTLFSFGNDNIDGCKRGPGTCLGVPYWNWGPMYTRLFDDIHKGRWTPSVINENINADSNQSTIVFGTNDALIDSSLKVQLGELLADLTKPANVDLPFRGPYKVTHADQRPEGAEIAAGQSISDEEMVRMCWFVEGLLMKSDPDDPTSADVPARVPDGTVVIGKNSDGSSNTPDCRQNQ